MSAIQILPEIKIYNFNNFQDKIRHLMKEIETLERKSETEMEDRMDISNRHSISSSDNEELVDQDTEELVDQDQSLDPDEPANCSIDSQNFLDL